MKTKMKTIISFTLLAIALCGCSDQQPPPASEQEVSDLRIQIMLLQHREDKRWQSNDLRVVKQLDLARNEVATISNMEDTMESNFDAQEDRFEAMDENVLEIMSNMPQPNHLIFRLTTGRGK